jgi:hypothetical protein
MLVMLDVQHIHVLPMQAVQQQNFYLCVHVFQDSRILHIQELDLMNASTLMNVSHLHVPSMPHAQTQLDHSIAHAKKDSQEMALNVQMWMNVH